jgi:hypothetical protein
MVEFGGNTFRFEQAAVPFVFEGRYFVLEPGEGEEPLVSVLREENGTPVAEVVRNEPGPATGVEVKKSPPGIVTVSDASGFVYKVRPGSETTVVFGRLTGEELTVRITDRNIVVMRDAGTPKEERVMTVERNQFVGDMVGLAILPNGIAVGAAMPAWLRKLLG